LLLRGGFCSGIVITRETNVQIFVLVKELLNNLTGDRADILLPGRGEEVVKSAEEKMKKSDHILKGEKF